MTAEPITVAGRRGALVRSVVPPISEDVRLPLGDRELRITCRPISTTQDAVFEQILNTLTIVE